MRQLVEFKEYVIEETLKMLYKYVAENTYVYTIVLQFKFIDQCIELLSINILFLWEYVCAN